MRLGRYGRRIPQTPQEVLDHRLFAADPVRLVRWMMEELGETEALTVWYLAADQAGRDPAWAVDVVGLVSGL